MAVSWLLRRWREDQERDPKTPLQLDCCFIRQHGESRSVSLCHAVRYIVLSLSTRLVLTAASSEIRGRTTRDGQREANAPRIKGGLVVLSVQTTRELSDLTRRLDGNGRFDQFLRFQAGGQLEKNDDSVSQTCESARQAVNVPMCPTYPQDTRFAVIERDHGSHGVAKPVCGLD